MEFQQANFALDKYWFSKLGSEVLKENQACKKFRGQEILYYAGFSIHLTISLFTDQSGTPS